MAKDRHGCKSEQVISFSLSSQLYGGDERECGKTSHTALHTVGPHVGAACSRPFPEDGTGSLVWVCIIHSQGSPAEGWSRGSGSPHNPQGPPPGILPAPWVVGRGQGEAWPCWYRGPPPHEHQELLWSQPAQVLYSLRPEAWTLSPGQVSTRNLPNYLVHIPEMQWLAQRLGNKTPLQLGLPEKPAGLLSAISASQPAP